jgi:hypothetical protein
MSPSHFVDMTLFDNLLIYLTEAELEEYIARLGWKFDSSTGVVEVPPNPDNQITSTVVQEDIKLQRMFRPFLFDHRAHRWPQS